MFKSRLLPFFICLIVMALLSLAFAGVMGGCKKSKVGGKDEEITLDEGGGGGDALKGGDGKIAFVRGSLIYLANADGSGGRQLTASAAGYGDLAFSPSGKKLAATKVEGDAFPQLVVVDAQSGKVTDVSWTNPDYSSAWNAAGVQPWFGTISWAGEDVLYCTGMKNPSNQIIPQVIKYDVSARRITVIEGDAQNPSLSPDGSELAYIRKPSDWAQTQGGMWGTGDFGELVVRDLTSGETRSLMGNMRGYVFEAVFSPDGERMAVTVFDEPDTTLILTDAKGNRLRTLTSIGPAGRIGHPSFSPGGERLIAHRGWREEPGGPYAYTVFMVPTGEENAQPTDFGEAQYPAWSPGE